MVSEVVGRFHRYRIATKLNKEDGEVQVCTLLYSLGKKAEQVYKTFTFSEEDEEDPDDYETVMAKLDNYFVPKVNTIYERARFHQRCQKPGETAEEYIRSLHDLADTCAFADGHPRFFNQLSSGLDVIGIAAEWLISTANTNMFTYEVSPVFILMEEVLLRKMQRIVGWSNGEGDGIFCPGGTISNLYSILVARYHFYPEVKTRGMGVLPQLGIFTSEHSHYSVKKSAAVLGLGTENVVVVKCDERGKMIPAELKSSIVTAQEKGLLKQCNELGAEYLFQTDKPYDVSYDTGDKSIQCGRHVDAFKLWLMWKAKGSQGFGAQVDKCLENAEYLYDQLQRRTGFELVYKNKPEHSNVCFWYTPPSLRGLPLGPDRDTRLHQVAPQIKGRMMEKGSVLIGYQPLGAKVNFFRCVFSNPATQQEDIDFLLDEIIRLGHDL